MTTYPNSQSNPNSAIPVWIAPAPAASGAKTKNITTNGNTLVKTGAGSATWMSVNTGGVTSTAKLYDGTDATGTLLGTFSTTAQNGIPINLPFSTGLFVVTAGGGAAADITLSYY